MHAGVWDKSAKGAHEVRGRTLGIVGYGNIGSQLSVVAESLGMRVYFYDVADKLALGNAQRCDSLDELLAVAETVTLHVDGRPGNAGLFGAEQFARMRPRSLFLNLCRGIVVDHDALREHLLSGHLAGAAVDVFAEEPKAAGDPFVSSLQGLPNVILTPHVGGSTEEAQQDIGRFVAGKLADFADHGSTSMSVNLPQVVTEPAAGRARVLHVHRNVPGVLATVNGVLADSRVNIERQSLSTRGDLGYVITDVAGDLSPELLDKLESLPGDRPAQGVGLRAASARRSRSGSQSGQRGSAAAGRRSTSRPRSARPDRSPGVPGPPAPGPGRSPSPDAPRPR